MHLELIFIFRLFFRGFFLVDKHSLKYTCLNLDFSDHVPRQIQEGGGLFEEHSNSFMGEAARIAVLFIQ